MQENERDFSVIKNRVLKYLEAKGLTKASFYKETGAPNGILSQKNGISEENLLRFVSVFPDVNLSWLLRGEGEMLLADGSGSRVADVVSPRDWKRDSVVYPTGVEVFEGNVADIDALSCACGDGDGVRLRSVMLYEWNTAAVLSCRSGRVVELELVGPLIFPDLPLCDGALYVRGDALHPQIKSGDIVLYKVVNPVSGEIVWNEKYLISYVSDGRKRTSVRYVHRADDASCIRLVGLDPRRSPQDIPLQDISALVLIEACVRYDTVG